MKAKANFRKKIIINTLLSLAIIAGLSYFIILPASEDIKEIRSKISELRIDLEKKYIRGQSLRKLSESLKIIESQIPKLDEIFIKKSEAINFITALEEIAASANIEQEINLVSDHEKKTETHNKTPLQLSTTGSFTNQIEYLNKLESLNYYINIMSLEIIGRHGEETNNINMNIFSNTYWLNN